MVIEILRREVYGTVKWYPVNATAQALAEIAGTKTLTEAVINVAMQRLGATVQFARQPGMGS
jgi:hypothetical protein